MVWAEGVVTLVTGSNLLLKEETLPVTTGEGERFLSVILVPVPDRPLKGEWTSQCSGLVMEKVLFLSTAGLGLRVDLDEKGVVPRDLVGV